MRRSASALTGEEAQDLFAQRPTVAARWTLNDGTGTVTADDGPSDHDATLSGNAFIDPAAAWVGTGALNLDGDGDYADTSGPVRNTAQSFTVAGWVSPAAGQNHRPDHLRHEHHILADRQARTVRAVHRRPAHLADLLL